MKPAKTRGHEKVLAMQARAVANPMTLERAQARHKEGMRRLTDDDFRRILELATADRKEKLEFVGTLLVEGRLIRGRSKNLLADAWGCNGSTVTRLIIDAQTVFQHEMGEPEEVRGMILGRLESIAEDALDKQKAVVVGHGKGESHVEMVPDPDHKAAIQGYKEIAEMLGLKVKKHDHNHEHKYDEESITKLKERANMLFASNGTKLVITDGEEVHEEPNQLPASQPSENPGTGSDGGVDVRHGEPSVQVDHRGERGGDGGDG